jgi:hypothetical protein
MFGHVIKQLWAYRRGELTDEEARRVARHLRHCARCREEYQGIQLGVHLIQHLPRAQAPASLWGRIEASLLERSGSAAERPKSFRPAQDAGWRHRTAAAVSLLLMLGVAAAWHYRQLPKASWEVARLAGAPTVGSDRIGETGRLRVGQWLETDGSSRAKINVAGIGHVEVEPNSRLRLVETRLLEHRLALARGTLHATILAPPRLFFVDTPSAVAVDLGCAYTLQVDDAGASLLRVDSGFVAFVRDGRESIVPAGALCATRPGIGPGTPYFEDAPAALRSALARFDFAGGGNEALRVVLAAARPGDSLTLWHLLFRVTGAGRRQVYDALTALTPPPSGVTREGVLRLDQKMLDLWKAEMEMHW